MTCCESVFSYYIELLSVTRNSTLYSLTISSFFDENNIDFYLAVDSLSNKEKSQNSIQFYFEYPVIFLLPPSIKYHESFGHVKNRD